MTITIDTLQAAEIEFLLNDLARLRITVFAEWPYLYNGDLEYEARYLSDFANAENAALIVAMDEGVVVGAATVSPIFAQDPEVLEPVRSHGIATDETYYFGESVLLPAYRGHGIGHRFFDLREQHARSKGAERCLFASVVRDPQHPNRPSRARDLQSFWKRRGYQPVEGLLCEISWKEHGEQVESPKLLEFWGRQLGSERI